MLRTPTALEMVKMPCIYSPVLTFSSRMYSFSLIIYQARESCHEFETSDDAGVVTAGLHVGS